MVDRVDTFLLKESNLHLFRHAMLGVIFISGGDDAGFRRVRQNRLRVFIILVLGPEGTLYH